MAWRPLEFASFTLDAGIESNEDGGWLVTVTNETNLNCVSERPLMVTLDWGDAGTTGTTVGGVARRDFKASCTPQAYVVVGELREAGVDAGVLSNSVSGVLPFTRLEVSAEGTSRRSASSGNWGR